MSRENVELLERFYDAFNAGRLEPWVDLVHPDFVYRTREEFPDGGSFDISSALDRISALRDLFDELRWEPEEFIDADGCVVVVVRQLARGRASKATLDQSISHVWCIDAGRARKLSVYSNRGRALAAVGLSE